MCVKVAGKLSTLKNVTGGVPQESKVSCPIFLYMLISLHIPLIAVVRLANNSTLQLSFPQKTCVLILHGIM